jgi:glycosyltransferase involved in cell wall biosynthesis
MPRISVVIPCFNSHATLRETLASLERQSCRDFDVTIVDDGSTAPEVAALLAELPQSIRIVRQENRGLPAARNAGIRASAGELVLPLDADDLFEPEAIGALVRALDESAADLAFCWVRRFGEENGISQMAFNSFEQLFVNEAPYCLLMRRGLFERLGGYDESLRFGHEDWEFNIRAVASGARAVVVPEPLFRYRVQASGLLKSTRLHRMAALWREIRERHPELYRPRALIAAWRRGRGEPSVWPLAIVAAWGAALTILPARAFNPIYRVVLSSTRLWRDRYKSRRHQAG